MSAAQPVWIDLSSSNPADLRAFYSQALGWDFTLVDPTADYHVVSDPAGNAIAGGLGPTAPAQSAGSLTAYLPVDDVAAAVARVVAAGGGVRRPMWEIPGLGSMAIITDPDGNNVGLWTSATPHTGG